MKKALYKFIFFKLMGWKISGTLEPSLKKCVMIVVPHTSWHDFYLGIFTRGIVGLEMNFVGKKRIVSIPIRILFSMDGWSTIRQNRWIE